MTLLVRAATFASRRPAAFSPSILCQLLPRFFETSILLPLVPPSDLFSLSFSFVLADSRRTLVPHRLLTRTGICQRRSRENGIRQRHERATAHRRPSDGHLPPRCRGHIRNLRVRSSAEDFVTRCVVLKADFFIARCPLPAGVRFAQLASFHDFTGPPS